MLTKRLLYKLTSYKSKKNQYFVHHGELRSIFNFVTSIYGDGAKINVFELACVSNGDLANRFSVGVKHFWKTRNFNSIINLRTQKAKTVEWNLDLTNLYVTRSLVWRTIFFSPAKLLVKCMERNYETCGDKWPVYRDEFLGPSVFQARDCEGNHRGC